ncbi:uncharacterized protein [Engystomops pustulosus]|uniref:uncharacterized protein isoform X1 n=1 Tax=Engystomops pustulosus TaxID=76066 RepID=UPI003AFB6958
MRALLVLGGLALGILLVAASHQEEQEETGIEANHERVQGDFVKEREIRSSDNKKKKIKPPRNPGGFTAMARPSKREKRMSEACPKNKKKCKCLSCYTSLISAAEKRTPVHTPEERRQRDTEEHEKLRKKHKHLKEKGKGKRRSKQHRERHSHEMAQPRSINPLEEAPKIHHSNKKWRREKKERGRDVEKELRLHRAGGMTLLGRRPTDLQEMTE